MIILPAVARAPHRELIDHVCIARDAATGDAAEALVERDVDGVEECVRCRATTCRVISRSTVTRPRDERRRDAPPHRAPVPRPPARRARPRTAACRRGRVAGARAAVPRSARGSREASQTRAARRVVPSGCRTTRAGADSRAPRWSPGGTSGWKTTLRLDLRSACTRSVACCAIVPVGRKSAASLPSSDATSDSSSVTDSTDAVVVERGVDRDGCEQVAPRCGDRGRSETACTTSSAPRSSDRGRTAAGFSSLSCLRADAFLRRACLRTRYRGAHAAAFITYRARAPRSGTRAARSMLRRKSSVVTRRLPRRRASPSCSADPGSGSRAAERTRWQSTRR